MVCRTRFAHPTPRIPFTVLAAVALVSGLPLSAQASISVVGGLANFDVVNNTGRPAYGFEIEFEDHNFYKGDVGSVFGLNRDFGPARGGALGVVRFGTVDVSDYDDGAGHHLGVRITYGGQFASGITTPFNAGSFNTPGESCWPGANAQWKNNPCDHYGVQSAKNPATTRYSWLVADPSQPAPTSFAAYTKVLAGIPAVNLVYTPPVAALPAQPAAAAQVQVQIQAIAPVRPAAPAKLEQPEVHSQWGEAFWVLTYKTKVNKHIDLGNLLQDDADMEAAEVESEWSILQRRPLDKLGDGNELGANEAKEKVDLLDDADNGKAVMRRYEFYRYTGLTNPEDGEVICDTACENDPQGLLSGKSFVGDFVGAQMAGYNIEAVAAVPEPQTWALMMGGLAAVGAAVRRQRPVR